ncbi:rhamnulokinase family protein [Cohnella sp. AR92]|uniref:rhamnulokinase n=1 Tax=Cohnella sp. AR92 TaxID=648716 RepID=UPI000F8EDA47|nr:rhamnulokinase family protein [Cohnella sp. AR92]RUS48033.1 rhamnulokinase [Cohnella sp. AR92]
MKTARTALAFDLGASGGRAFIGRLHAEEDGSKRLETVETHRFSNEPVQVGTHLHWNILQLLRELKKGIRGAYRQGFEPTTFGIDSWGVDFGLLDANGELIGLPYHYRDPQTEGLPQEVNALVGEERLYLESGVQFMPFNTIYQLYALAKSASPKLGIADALLLTPDLLVYMLTGIRACEYTMATTTALYNPEKMEWNKPLLDRLGLPSKVFLEPVHPGTVIGSLSKEVVAELQVPDMRAVAVGSHDTESAVAAIPALNGPFAYLVCGTWSLLGTELSEPLLSTEAMRLEFSNEGGVGGAYQLLKNIMGLWILQECKREWEERGEGIGYPELTEQAEQAEPFRSLIQPDDARFFGQGDMTGRIRAFCEETGQAVPRNPGEFARCILESLALRYRQALEQMERLTGADYSGLHMVGGGIQNKLLCRFTAQAIGKPVWAGPVEASAIGNLLVQFIATGECRDLQEARRLVAESFPIETFEARDALGWQAAYERFAGYGQEG